MASNFPIGFATHQMSRDKEFRSLVIAPMGYKIVEFDAAGQEFRWMAIKSGDPKMLELCAPGEDAHSYMGASITHRDYRELVTAVHAGEKAANAGRKMGKLANLSLQYRTSAKKLLVKARVEYDIPMLLPEAQHVRSVYLSTYLRVPVYWKNQIMLTKQLGYVETISGRRVQVIGDWTGPLGWSMESTAINYPIQGTGAEQKYLALAMLRPILAQYDAEFMIDLHDGLYFTVPEAKTMAFAERAKKILDNLPYRQAWGFDPPIPLPFDCKIGESWGTLKEVTLN